MAYYSVCRSGDQVTGTCNNHAHPRSFIGTWDNIQPSSTQSTSNGLIMIRQGDVGTTDCGHQFVADGHFDNTVISDGKKLQLVGDTVTVLGPDGGTGVSITGSNNVISI